MASAAREAVGLLMMRFSIVEKLVGTPRPSANQRLIRDPGEWFHARRVRESGAARSVSGFAASGFARSGIGESRKGEHGFREVIPSPDEWFVIRRHREVVFIELTKRSDLTHGQRNEVITRTWYDYPDSVRIIPHGTRAIQRKQKSRHAKPFHTDSASLFEAAGSGCRLALEAGLPDGRLYLPEFGFRAII